MHRLGAPTNTAFNYLGLLPGVRMFECGELMDQVRWIKTAGEVTLLEEAANILDDAYLEALPHQLF